MSARARLLAHHAQPSQEVRPDREDSIYQVWRGMGRQFLNLVMHDLRSSIYSLYRMDLGHLFYKTAEIAVQAEAKVKNINKPRALSMIEPWNDLRKRVVSFETSNNFFTLLRENSIMFADSAGRTTLLDIDFKSIVTMPPMRNGKGPNCIVFSAADPDPLKYLDSQCLFVLDLVPDSSANSSTFEYLTYLGSDHSQRLVSSHYDFNWAWRALPVPPFIDNPAYSRASMMCSSMLLGRSTICISSGEEGIGTYSFDMVTHEWSQAGNWVLPFCGKAEYVPKLKHWFALSASSPHSLCALGLPAMDFQLPAELLCSWDYLDLPDETPYQRHHVNLGSGKFCIVSFFKTLKSACVEEMIEEDESAVFTGVEVRPCKNGEIPVRMIKHMSKRYSFGRNAIRWVL